MIIQPCRMPRATLWTAKKEKNQRGTTGTGSQTISVVAQFYVGYVFARVVGYVSRFSHVQTLRVSCTVTVRFIEVGGYVIWHLHKTVLQVPTLLKKWGPAFAKLQ